MKYHHNILRQALVYCVVSILLLGIVPISSNEVMADNLTTGKCGENISYSFDQSSGTLTLSGTGNTYDYSGIDDWDSEWAKVPTTPFFDNENIKKIVINQGIKSLGRVLFEQSGVTSVSLPDSIETIGNGSFDTCEKLNNLVIPYGVRKIDDGAFSWCSSLIEINLPSSVNYLGDGSFCWCEALQRIRIPNSVTHIGAYAFGGGISILQFTGKEAHMLKRTHNSITFPSLVMA